MSHRRRRCNACLEAVVLEDALVTSDEDGALVFCDEACLEDFESQLEGDELARHEHRRAEDLEEFDPILEDVE